MPDTKKQLKYLTAEEIRAGQDEDVRVLLEGYKGDAMVHMGKGMVERCAEYLKKQKSNVTLLDCGVASGWFCSKLFESGFRRINGVDICDYRSYDVKKSGLVKKFEEVDLSWENIPWEDRYFDIITGWCVLPHLENPHNFIREAHRVLAEGGYFIVSMPHINSLRTRKMFLKTGNIERYNENNNHISIFTPAVFKNTVLKGFELVNVDYYINPGIFKGRLWWIKRIGIERKWFGQKKFKHWFGTNIVYVLKKRES